MQSLSHSEVLYAQGAGSLFEALGAGKAVIAVPNALLMHNHQVHLIGLKNHFLMLQTASNGCPILLGAVGRGIHSPQLSSGACLTE